ncbi:hypothetical protein SAY86_005946 [Trapa natans]|nr:hypothetical protein SAY86_005946 [Trapa natans]
MPFIGGHRHILGMAIIITGSFFFGYASSDNPPQQVHISLVGRDWMRVSWVTDFSAPPTVVYGTSRSYGRSAMGTTSSYWYFFYKSGKIHEAVIGPLNPDTVYYYQCSNDWSREFSFKTPPAKFPIKFIVVGDLGQNEFTDSTLKHISESGYHLLILPGGLSYSSPLAQRGWDSFGKLVEPLASQRPWMVTEGRQEIQRIPILHPGRFSSYNRRWQMPFKESGSASNLYYSFEAGGVHVIMLGSYTDFSCASPQYKWLQKDLREVDRDRTPWVVVVVHAPWYNTNAAHQGEEESDKMKATMEGLLYQAGVDAIFAGHVHAYERFTRVYDGKPDDCGPVYITVGVGGNWDQGLDSWFNSPNKNPISMFREASYGHGELEVVNATHMQWTWHTNANNEMVISDSVWITSLSSNPKCNKQQTR